MGDPDQFEPSDVLAVEAAEPYTLLTVFQCRLGDGGQ